MYSSNQLSWLLAVLTSYIFLYMIWAPPLSLATTRGIVIYFLFLWVIRCFSSPGSPDIAMYLQYRITTLLVMSSLIRISAGLRSFAAHHSFSQLVTSFFGAMYQGILLYALCSLFFRYISISVFSLIVNLFFLNYKKNHQRTFSIVILSH